MEQTDQKGNPYAASNSQQSPREKTRAVVVSTACDEADLGGEAYPYRLACRALAPLVARWACTTEVTRPESRLDHALWRARRQNREPLHLSFLPLHAAYLTQRARNVAFSFCAFPDVPNTDLARNPRHNYVSLANRLALVLAPNRFSRESFLRAGVKAPIHVVPVPVASAYFDLPAWEPGQRTTLECPCYVFPQPEGTPPPGVNPWVPAKAGRFGFRGGARHVYQNYVRPRWHARLDRYAGLARRVLAAARGGREEDAPITYPVSPRLELCGVVYTTVLNPLDPCTNWQDLLSAYLLALGGREDALLIVTLAVGPRQAARAFNHLLRHYRKLGLRHRCKLAVVTSSLSETQMVELARASTYYLQASRAEGLGLPLHDFLAAGRPGISPAHTAMGDYFRDELGFVVASHPEPTCWPHDPDGRHTTTWHRVVWQSLHDQLQISHATAKLSRARYLALAGRARERIRSLAGAESVWPRLAAALDFVWEAAGRQAVASVGGLSAVVSRAS